MTPPSLTRPVVLLTVVAVLVATAATVLPARPGPRTTALDALLAAEPGEGLAAARAGGHRGDYAAALTQAGAVEESLLGSLRPWEDRGPHNIGGRLTDVALAPDGTIVAGAASGGVWVSTDEGRTLTPSWPADLTPAIGAVAVTTAGVWLAGTGEANAGGGSLTYGGTGVYRSTDAGASWAPAGLADSGVIARIEPHPTDPDVLWLAAGGDLFGPGGQRGIYRSTDAGRSWTQVLAPTTPTAGGADIAVDPSDPDHLLATMWDRQRTPDRRRYGGAGSGTWSSTDGGDSWVPVAGLPGFAEDSGRIAVGFSPADPRRVYAVVTRGDGRAAGLWRSDDGGQDWRRVDEDPLYTSLQFIFAWWFGRVFPAPDDPDRVLVPGLRLLESVDGGVTFTADGIVHPDQHDLVWDPADAGRAVLATDGGMYVSDAGGRTLTWTATAEQGFTQLYDVATAAGGVAGGFQDRGCRASDATPQDWRGTVACGDGTRVVAHPGRPGEVIMCGQYGRCQVTTDLGRQGRQLGLPDEERTAWATPLIRLPDDPDRLLFAGTAVHASDDAGQTWRRISPDLTSGRSPDPDYPFATVTALAARADGGTTLAAGTDDGSVWLTRDGGQDWDRVVEGDRWVTTLAFTGTALLVGTSGYRSGTPDAQVLRLDDDGVTAVGAGLPQAPVNELLVVAEGDGSARQVVLAATDVGVFVSHDVAGPGAGRGTGSAPDTRPTWRRVGADLPQAPVTALDMDALTRQLTVGTYGRGVWTTRVAGLSRHAGADRYATAAAVAGTAPAGGGPSGDGPAAGGTVLLASGEDFPDALAAAALAAADPTVSLVLSRPGTLPAPSRDLITRLSPARIVVVGGPAAISPQVADAARQAAGGAPVELTRIEGAGRHATAAALAGEGPRDVVVLATAGSPFDALAGAPLAAALGAPVLLVDPDRLPAETADALTRLSPGTLIALGGPAAVSEGVLTQAVAAAGAAGGQPVTGRRVAGPDRVATAVAVAREAAKALQAGGVPATTTWLASAATYPDALAAAATGQPVLLTDRDRPSTDLVEAVRTIAPVHVRVAGGPSAVGEAVLDRLRGG